MHESLVVIRTFKEKFLKINLFSENEKDFTLFVFLKDKVKTLNELKIMSLLFEIFLFFFVSGTSEDDDRVCVICSKFTLT